MKRPTMKNLLVWRYYEAHNANYKGFKQVFEENKAEIATQFNITTYAGFRVHCAKVLKWKGDNQNGD